MVINISLICYLTGAAVKDRTVIFGYLIAVFISKIVDDVKSLSAKDSFASRLSYGDFIISLRHDARTL